MARLLLASFVLALAVPFAAVAGDPYLRVGLFVEHQQADGTANPGDCLSFAPAIPPGDNKFLRLYADSNAPTALMVLAVDRKTRDVSTECPPRLWVQREGFAEIVYPPSDQVGIPYRADTGLDLFVVSIPLAFEGLDKLKNNLAQIASLKDESDGQLYLLRAGSVRQQVEQWFQDQNKASCVAQYRPPAKAATQRSGSATTILWREKHLVHKFVTVDADKPFVARIPVIPAKQLKATPSPGESSDTKSAAKTSAE